MIGTYWHVGKLPRSQVATLLRSDIPAHHVRLDSLVDPGSDIGNFIFALPVPSLTFRNVMGDVVSHVDLFAAPVILQIASLAAGVRGQSRRDQ